MKVAEPVNPDSFMLGVQIDPFVAVEGYRPVPVGKTLEEGLALHGFEDCAEYFVFTRKGPEAEKVEADYKPGRGEAILIELSPEGSDRGKSVFKRLVKVFAVTAAIFIGGAFLVGAIGGSALGIKAVAYFGFNYLADNLIDIYAESRNRGAGSGDESSTLDESNLLFGAGNALIRGAPVPVPLGYNRVSPQLASSPYPEIEGDESYLNLTMLLGEKPVAISDVRIGTTPIEQFDDYELTLDLEGDGKFDKFPTVHDGPLSIQVDENFTVRRTLENVDRIGVMVMYPNGLYRYDNGAERDLPAEFEIAYRKINPDTDQGEGEWTLAVKNPKVPRSNAAIPLFYNIGSGVVSYQSIPAVRERQSYTYTRLVYDGNPGDGPREVTETGYRWVETSPARQVAIKADLTKGQYEVRIKRGRRDRALPPASGASGQEGAVGQQQQGDRNYVERLDWVSLQSIRKAAPVAGDGYAMAHLRIKATNQVNGRIENVNLVRGRKIPLFEPTTSTWGLGKGKVTYGAWSGGTALSPVYISSFDTLTAHGVGYFDRNTAGRPSGTFEGAYSYFAETNLKERQFACHGPGDTAGLHTRSRTRADTNAATPWGSWTTWSVVGSRWVVGDADKWRGEEGRPFRMSSSNAPTYTRRSVYKNYWGIISNAAGRQEIRIGGWGNAYYSRVAETAVKGLGVSTNPAEIYRAILTEIIADPLDLSLIDDDSIEEWWRFCNDNDLTYSRDIRSEIPVEKVLVEVCYAGLASPIHRNGRYGVIIDRPIPVVKALITPRNSDSFRGHIDAPDYPDALQCNFINRDEDFRADSRIVPDSGFTEATAENIRVIDMPGITTAKAVRRVAQHIMKDLRLRPESFSVDVDFEHFVVDRGDRVWLSHDIAQVGQDWGRIVKIDSQSRVLTMDQPCTFVTGQDHSLIVRKNDNTFVTLEAGGSLTTYEVNVNSVAGLEVGNLWAFGIKDRTIKDCFVVSKEPKQDFGARLTLQPYVPDVFTTTPDPGYRSVISRRVAQNYTGPPRPRIVNILSDERSLPQDLAGRRLPAMNVFLTSSSPGDWNASYTGARQFRVRWKLAGRPDSEFQVQDVPTEGGGVSTLITGLQARQIYVVEAQAIDSRGGESSWVSERHTVIGNPTNPPDVSGFDLNVDKGQLTASWQYNDPPGDMDHFTIYWSRLPLSQVDDITKMKPIIEEHPAAQRTANLPALTGTFAISAFNTSGVGSANPSFAEAPEVDPIPTLNAFIINEAGGRVTTPTGVTNKTPFSGTKVNLETRGGGGLLALEKVEQNASAPKMNAWTSLGDEDFRMAYAKLRFFRASGTYTTEHVDMGGVFNVACDSDVAATSSERFDNEIKLWVPLSSVDPLSGGAADDYSVDTYIQMGTGDPNSITWGERKPLISGVFRGRFVRFIVDVESPDPNVSPAISRMTFTIAFTGREERIESVTPLTSGLTRVNYRTPYFRPPVVTPGVQGAQPGDVAIISDATASSFNFRVLNADGDQIVRVCDFIVQGYGSRTV